MDNNKNTKKIVDREMKKITKKLMDNLENYRKTVTFLTADCPIQTLCLPKTLENILIAAGCFRVYDLLNRDLAKIKGLGDSRLTLLTARLNEFLAMG